MAEADIREIPKLESAPGVQYWQRSMSSWMKANERILRGFVAVLHREVELGQELLQLNLESIRLPQGKEKPFVPDYTRQAEKSFKAIELISIGAREIVDEFAQCVVESSRTLFDEISSASQEVARDTAATVTRETEKVAGTLLKAGQVQ